MITPIADTVGMEWGSSQLIHTSLVTWSTGDPEICVEAFRVMVSHPLQSNRPNAGS